MKLKILHVEDDLMFSHFVRSLLEKQGFSVYSAPDGEKAWAMFLNEEPDCCLLDIVMPGISGIDLGEKIRSMNQEVPIFYLSGEELSSVQAEIYGRGGAHGFLSKTRNIRDLSKSINDVIKPNKTNDNKSYEQGNWQFNLQYRKPDFSNRNKE